MSETYLISTVHLYDLENYKIIKNRLLYLYFKENRNYYS